MRKKTSKFSAKELIDTAGKIDRQTAKVADLKALEKRVAKLEKRLTAKKK